MFKKIKQYWPDIKQALGSAYSRTEIRVAGLLLMFIGYVLLLMWLVKQ